MGELLFSGSFGGFGLAGAVYPPKLEGIGLRAAIE